ncbi:hypothetical protein KOW79_002992 [Hemibagrus wyckioides]|uniref:Uncharacterized protein n=1 Tax=Hemibagrus wyckioides TaxID=337641 RepID=A0A9D3SQJ0_9TELE|nr:hypothetical protein KOW79_002992 [Hemibagrus wyckioides]
MTSTCFRVNWAWSGRGVVLRRSCEVKRINTEQERTSVFSFLRISAGAGRQSCNCSPQLCSVRISSAMEPPLASFLSLEEEEEE